MIMIPDGCPLSTYLEKASHGLQTTDKSKVDAILKRREHKDAAGKEALPMCLPRFLRRRRHSEETKRFVFACALSPRFRLSGKPLQALTGKIRGHRIDARRRSTRRRKTFRHALLRCITFAYIFSTPSFAVPWLLLTHFISAGPFCLHPQAGSRPFL